MQTYHEKQIIDNQPKPKQLRLVSLDAFRGFTIVGMLIVNNLALDAYTPKILKHAGWNSGVTFADMVFPWFLFIVGVAIPYSAASHKAKGLAPWKYDLRVLSRTIWLLAIGCLLDSSLVKSPIFGLGVLQLIGLAYMVGALLYDLSIHRRLAVAAALLVGYWAMIRFIPIPGIGAGYFTENKNIIRHLNEVYLGQYHLKGIFSTVPTSALVIIGSAFGDIIRSENLPKWHKAIWIVGCGVGLALVGFLWNFDLPFNKQVWTSSYILFSAGLGAIVLGIFYAIADCANAKKWAFPLVVFGSNAILAYVLPILAKVYILQSWTIQTNTQTTCTIQQYLLNSAKSAAGNIGGGWLYTMGYVAIWWLVLLRLYTKKVFLRV